MNVDIINRSSVVIAFLHIHKTNLFFYLISNHVL